MAREDEFTKLIFKCYLAMNLLGLSTQVPMNVVFLKDGSPRKIRLGNDKTITFKHTVPKILLS